MIFESPSSSMPSISSDVKMCQRPDMSWWQQANLGICVGFQNIDGLDLEGLVLKADLMVFGIPS